ncbi:hypothetical protein [Desulfovibrio falkowii]|uniref:Uncharacterized protein n=1 Tax=Desulfovibrio falkowii TaxID=3136602 RepID=A0ABQ0E5Q0_9BACT
MTLEDTLITFICGAASMLLFGMLAIIVKRHFKPRQAKGSVARDGTVDFK